MSTITKRTFTRTNYLDEVFNPGKLPTTVVWCATALQTLQKHRGVKFDTLAFTGTSGAAVGFAVAAIVGVPVTYVRKPTRTAHFPELVEGLVGAKSYVFIDDFVDTGATFKRIKKAMGKAKCTGAILYAGFNAAGTLRLSPDNVIARYR